MLGWKQLLLFFRLRVSNLNILSKCSVSCSFEGPEVLQSSGRLVRTISTNFHLDSISGCRVETPHKNVNDKKNGYVNVSVAKDNDAGHVDLCRNPSWAFVGPFWDSRFVPNRPPKCL